MRSIIEDNLRIRNGLKKTLLKIERLQGEEEKLKEVTHSFQKAFDNKILNKEDALKKIFITFTKLKGEVKVLQDEIKNNSSLVVARQTQINDLSSQKKQVAKPDSDGETVDNEIKIRQESKERVKSIVKEIGNAFIRFKNIRSQVR